MQAAGGCSAVYHAMDIDDVLTIMKHPKTMIASDGGVEAPSDRMPHPRNYGAFARVLGYYVREQNVMPLHTAIHKMTMMPANIIGLSDRGRLSVGAIADITVFDPGTIEDKATFENPHQYAVGTLHVFVNGEQVLSDGEMTEKRPGQVIRSR
jgi:N-acyl-D-amino-acid deacylase